MFRFRGALACMLAILLGGCAAPYPVNPPIAKVDPSRGYRYTARSTHFKGKKNLVILAFSGGGTRAAAFSYGVLEALRQIEVVSAKGESIRMLDEVDVITGVSGGSFTALAYGLYGEKLFDDYEASFLKRDVQGELVRRVLNPLNWRAWGRAEIAAHYYDEILFHGATFADLDRGDRPFIIASATDITSGIRVGFHQGMFDVLCSDVNAVPLSRAATASSAVPLAFSPVTLKNYGGTCNFELPPFLATYSDPATAPRAATRAARHVQDLMGYEDSVHRPYIHLLDGGLSDNLGMRSILESIEEMEALTAAGKPTPLDSARRIIVFIVNSQSYPKTDWYERERPPGEIALLIRAAGVPIDHYSYDSVESLKDIVSRWHSLRQIADSLALADNRDPVIEKLLKTPNVDLYAIDVSFSALQDQAERDYLNNLPTSFVLPPEAVDRLRAAATTIIRESPDFKRLLKDAEASIVIKPVEEAGHAQFKNQ